MQAQNRKWYADSLWFLLNLTPNELREIFPDHKWESLKGKRKLYKRKIKTGEETMPPKPDDYEFGDTPEQIRAYLSGTNHTTEEKENIIIDGRSRAYLHKLLDKTLDETNINPSHVSKFSVRAGSHEGYIKNSDGEIEYTKDLKNGGISLVVEPEKFEPKWPVCNRVESEHLPRQKTTKNKNDTKVAVILPDLQLPYVDNKALSVALQVVQDIKPDKVILLGDALDLPAFGTYGQRPEYALETQGAINQLHNLMASLRKELPSSELVVLAGNHEFRLEKYLLRNAMAAYGLRRADQMEHWPVMSVPYLCAFDSLDVEYVDGYPSNKYWINERLQCIHGHVIRGNGLTAKAIVQDERVSVIYGHVHRIESQYKTVNVYEGGKTSFAHSPGALCRLDGHVPSYHSGHDTHGKPVKNMENWQQGFCVVYYKDGDSPFHLEQVFINTFQEYQTYYQRKLYKPDLKYIPWKT